MLKDILIGRKNFLEEKVFFKNFFFNSSFKKCFILLKMFFLKFLVKKCFLAMKCFLLKKNFCGKNFSFVKFCF
jgi:hypothetical protein